MNTNETNHAQQKKSYKFKVLEKTYEVTDRYITGRQVLEKASLTPPEMYKLDLKVHGNRYKNIPLDETVDLAEPGIEKFTYIRRDQTEG